MTACSALPQPIDAFHQPGQPGLRTLAQGEVLVMNVQSRYQPLTR